MVAPSEPELNITPEKKKENYNLHRDYSNWEPRLRLLSVHSTSDPPSRLSST